MNRLVWMLIRRVYLLPAVLVFATTLAWNWDLLTSWRYGVWTSTSFATYATLQVVGPVLSGAGAWVAVRLASDRTLTSLPSLARSGNDTLGLHLGVGAAVLVGAYFAGLVPVLAFTTATATHGFPGPLQLFDGLVSAVALVCIGYALGRLLPWVIVPPITAVAVFLALGLAHNYVPSVSPVRSQIPTVPWIVENPAVLSSQGALYALLAISALWSVTALVRKHASSAWRRRSIAGMVAAAPLAFVPLFAIWDPALQVDQGPEQLPRPVCTAEGEAPVCVHPALQRDLPEVTAVIGELMYWYGGELPAGAKRFEAGTVSRLLDPPPLLFDLYPQAPIREYIVLYAPGGLAGMPACYQKYLQGNDGNPAYVTPEPVGVSGAVQAWLTQQMAAGQEQVLVDAGSDRGAAYLKRLNQLSDERVRTWIRDHRDQLFSCSLRAKSLP